MPFNASLAYMVTAVIEELGDASEFISQGEIERWLNEGQRRYAPDYMKEVVVDVSWDAAATSFALPSDFYSMAQLVSVANEGFEIPGGKREFAGRVYFSHAATSAFEGKMFYYAYYPDITDVADCELPEIALDGLESYALYKAYKKIASNRALYKRFATVIGGNISVEELLALSEGSLADYNDIRDLGPPSEPELFYQGI